MLTIFKVTVPLFTVMLKGFDQEVRHVSSTQILQCVCCVLDSLYEKEKHFFFYIHKALTYTVYIAKRWCN